MGQRQTAFNMMREYMVKLKATAKNKLIHTNKYLANPKLRVCMIRRAVISSTAREFF